MNHFRHLRLRSKVQAYVDGELDGPTAGQVRAHLIQCWWCSGDAQTHRLVRVALRRRRDRVASLPMARLRRFVRGIDRSRPDSGRPQAPAPTHGTGKIGVSGFVTRASVTKASASPPMRLSGSIRLLD